MFALKQKQGVSGETDRLFCIIAEILFQHHFKGIESIFVLDS